MPGDPHSPSVAWRDGVHLVDTAIWCDARRTRDVCFVSAADAIRTAHHGQIVATAETLALLARPDARPDSQLAVAPGRPFTLGDVRIELFRSGYSHGSASLLVQIGNKRVVYAGAVNPRSQARPCDVRACDVLVVNGRYAAPRFVFPAAQETLAALRDWAVTRISAGTNAVILVSSALKALDLAHDLGALPLFAHRAFCDWAQRTGAPAPFRRWNNTAARPGVLLWPAAQREKLQMPGASAPHPSRSTTVLSGSECALVSGAALDADAVAAVAPDLTFPLSNHADSDALRQYVAATGAKEVHLTDASEAGAEALRETHRRVQRLGPPVQLALWGDE